jgi:hypothetical protein
MCLFRPALANTIEPANHDFIVRPVKTEERSRDGIEMATNEYDGFVVGGGER